MDDERSKAQYRITQLMKEEPASIAYLVGYLSYGHSNQTLADAVDAWLSHDETVDRLAAAYSDARDRAQNAQE